MDDKLTTKDAITVLQDLQDWLYFSAMNGGTAIQREAIDMAIRALKSQPSEGPQRMRAKWIATTSLQEGQITWIDYKCSNCSHHREKPMNYCEVCGAKMERERHESN